MNDEVKEFLESIPETRFFQPDGRPLKRWMVFTGATLEQAREAGQEAAVYAAARGNQLDAAWIAAWENTQDDVRNVVGAAAWYSATKDVSDSLRSAAWDVALLAGLLNNVDYPGKAKHLQHARDRWRVWQKGYCLLCDVGGVLYVYYKKEDRK